MSQVIFIVGPTAIGKTDIAFALAKKIHGQIVSCDSMLIYQEPKIITANPPEQYLQEIKHHFVGIISVSQTFNVFNYFKAASAVIVELYRLNIPVIVCGGSGLYFKALLNGIFEDGNEDVIYRSMLQRRACLEGNIVLHQELAEIDPITAKKISINDLKRIIRALEVFHRTGKPISEKKLQTNGLWGKIPITIFGLTMPREKLYDKINTRVETMFNHGAIEEVHRLIRLPLSLTAGKIIGISELADYFSGISTLNQAKELIRKNTRNFAKRQLTWFRADKRIQWIDIADKNMSEILKLITRDL